MPTVKTNRAFYLLFIGFKLTPPAEFSLKSTRQWQHISILPPEDPEKLTIMNTDHGKVIGKALSFKLTPLPVLKKFLKDMRKQLEECLPSTYHATLKEIVFTLTQIT